LIDDSEKPKQQTVIWLIVKR